MRRSAYEIAWSPLRATQIFLRIDFPFFYLDYCRRDARRDSLCDNWYNPFGRRNNELDCLNLHNSKDQFHFYFNLGSTYFLSFSSTKNRKKLTSKLKLIYIGGNGHKSFPDLFNVDLFTWDLFYLKRDILRIVDVMMNKSEKWKPTK